MGRGKYETANSAAETRMRHSDAQDPHREGGRSHHSKLFMHKSIRRLLEETDMSVTVALNELSRSIADQSRYVHCAKDMDSLCHAAN